MERNSSITAIYRIAPNSAKTKKDKPGYVDNLACLNNFLDTFEGDEVVIIADNFAVLDDYTDVIHINLKSNAGSLEYALNYAFEKINTDYVYFVEDDYIHKKGFTKILLEGLKRFNYVSLYDHPDKYEYELDTKLFLTDSTHWRLAGSTTMTFATHMRYIKSDIETMLGFIRSHDIPNDYQMWVELTKYRSLATPIPGWSTHGETKWLSPFTNWQKQI